jgi:hypothetical protein
MEEVGAIGSARGTPANPAVAYRITIGFFHQGLHDDGYLLEVLASAWLQVLPHY